MIGELCVKFFDKVCLFIFGGRMVLINVEFLFLLTMFEVSSRVVVVEDVVFLFVVMVIFLSRFVLLS